METKKNQARQLLREFKGDNYIHGLGCLGRGRWQLSGPLELPVGHSLWVVHGEVFPIGRQDHLAISHDGLRPLLGCHLREFASECSLKPLGGCGCCLLLASALLGLLGPCSGGV